MFKIFLSATFVALMPTTAIAGDISKAIQLVEKFGEKDFAPSTSKELYVEHDGVGYTITHDDGAISVATTIRSCVRYDAPLVVFVNDADGDGLVESVTYGLDEWKCEGSNEFATTLSQDVLQSIYDNGFEAAITAQLK